MSRCGSERIPCSVCLPDPPAQLPPAWDRLLGSPFAKEPYRSTLYAAEAAALLETVYPPRADWFAALRLTPPEQLRVVILGQDPYHGPGQAMGLAFSVPEGIALPPSLRNIYRELEADLGCTPPPSGDLSPWARQGVLLLNTVLTVAEGRANSHKNLGWQRFTKLVLAAVSALPQPVAFVLWGTPAQKAFEDAVGRMQNAAFGDRRPAIGNIDQPPVGAHTGAPGEAVFWRDSISSCPSGHLSLEGRTSEGAAGPRLILTAPHPSPLSAHRGFFGSRPFSQINAFLEANGEAPICWRN